MNATAIIYCEHCGDTKQADISSFSFKDVITNLSHALTNEMHNGEWYIGNVCLCPECIKDKEYIAESCQNCEGYRAVSGCRGEHSPLWGQYVNPLDTCPAFKKDGDGDE